MTQRTLALLITLVASTLVPSFWSPQKVRAEDYSYREGGFQLGGGLGFTASMQGEAAFSFGLDGNYYFTQNISVAPRLAFALDGDVTGIFIMADALYHFDIRSLRELVPFVGLGLGASIIKPDGGDASGAFTIEIPFGAEYYVTRQLAIGSEMYLMFPVHKFDDNFFFQWHVATIRYIF